MTRRHPIWFFQNSHHHGAMWMNVKKIITIQWRMTFSGHHHRDVRFSPKIIYFISLFCLPSSRSLLLYIFASPSSFFYIETRKMRFQVQVSPSSWRQQSANMHLAIWFPCNFSLFISFASTFYSSVSNKWFLAFGYFSLSLLRSWNKIYHFIPHTQLYTSEQRRKKDMKKCEGRKMRRRSSVKL